MLSLLSQEYERQGAIPALRSRVRSTVKQTYKKFHCIVLGSVKRKTSKTILAGKKKY